jgi:hypothetical protein
VFLDLFNTVLTKSILRFALYHTVDEVSCCIAPAVLDLFFPYLNLLLQNIITDFFSRFSSIGALNNNEIRIFKGVTYFAIHAFKSHDTYCEVVYGDRVVQTAHHLWSHVTWSARSISSIVFSPNASNSKISYS